MSAEQSARSISDAEGVDRVRALQRVLYRSAKSDPARRFHALFTHVARSDILWKAWSDVAANRGAPGVHGVSVDDVEDSGVGEFLEALAGELKAKTYRPKPLRRVHIPKSGKPGATRPLGIPSVRDRVVMAAAKIVLEPIFEADFLPASFGFRPRRSAHMAIEAIRVQANRGADWVLDADVSDCFGSIDHDVLMALVGKRVSDRSMLKLIHGWLRAGVLEEGAMSDSVSARPRITHLAAAGQHRPARLGRGVGEGRSAPRCAHPLRRRFRRPVRHQGPSRRGPGPGGSGVGRSGFAAQPGQDPHRPSDQGRTELRLPGFHHRKVEAWRWPGRFYMQRWPSKRAMASIAPCPKVEGGPC